MGGGGALARRDTPVSIIERLPGIFKFSLQSGQTFLHEKKDAINNHQVKDYPREFYSRKVPDLTRSIDRLVKKKQ